MGLLERDLDAEDVDKRLSVLIEVIVDMLRKPNGAK